MERNSRIDKVLKEIENNSRKYNLPCIGPEKGKVLANLIRKYKPKRILEIGTLHGYSAILMAKYANEDCKVITIEINKNSAKVANENIKKAGLSKKVKVVVGDALRVHNKIKGKFDMMFIDAVKEEYLLYLKIYEKKLKKNAIIVADNTGIFKNYLKDYLKYVRESGRYQSYPKKVRLEFSKLEDQMEISIKLF